jgi:hypothetical protein
MSLRALQPPLSIFILSVPSDSHRQKKPRRAFCIGQYSALHILLLCRDFPVSALFILDIVMNTSSPRYYAFSSHHDSGQHSTTMAVGVPCSHSHLLPSSKSNLLFHVHKNSGDKHIIIFNICGYHAKWCYTIIAHQRVQTLSVLRITCATKGNPAPTPSVHIPRSSLRRSAHKYPDDLLSSTSVNGILPITIGVRKAQSMKLLIHKDRFISPLDNLLICPPRT